MTRTSPTVAALLAATLAAGCTNNPQPAPAPIPTAADPTPTPATEPTEGPATQAATRNGITIKLAKLEQLDPKLGVDIPPGNTLIRAHITYTNTTNQPIQFDPAGRYITILHGTTRTEAQPDAGYQQQDPAKQLSSNDPTRIPPGQTVTIYRSSVVPNPGLAELAVTVEIPATGPAPVGTYIFAGAQQLLVR